jgi:hypothetical protein
VRVPRIQSSGGGFPILPFSDEMSLSPTQPSSSFFLFCTVSTIVIYFIFGICARGLLAMVGWLPQHSSLYTLDSPGFALL